MIPADLLTIQACNDVSQRLYDLLRVKAHKAAGVPIALPMSEEGDVLMDEVNAHCQFHALPPLPSLQERCYQREMPARSWPGYQTEAYLTEGTREIRTEMLLPAYWSWADRNLAPPLPLPSAESIKKWGLIDAASHEEYEAGGWALRKVLYESYMHPANIQWREVRRIRLYHALHSKKLLPPVSRVVYPEYSGSIEEGTLMRTESGAIVNVLSYRAGILERRQVFTP